MIFGDDDVIIEGSEAVVTVIIGGVIGICEASTIGMTS